MTDAKEVLEAARQAGIRLNELKERRAMYMDLAFSLGGGSLDGMPHGNGVHSRVQNAAVRLADVDAEITDTIVNSVDTIVAADKLISRLTRETYREILYRRYIKGQTWRFIETDMNYTDRSNMFHAHGKALNEIRKIYNDDH